MESESHYDRPKCLIVRSGRTLEAAETFAVVAFYAGRTGLEPTRELQ